MEPKRLKALSIIIIHNQFSLINKNQGVKISQGRARGG